MQNIILSDKKADNIQNIILSDKKADNIPKSYFI